MSNLTKRGRQRHSPKLSTVNLRINDIIKMTQAKQRMSTNVKDRSMA